MEKNGKRYFTQKELEKHINKRLIRERKKYDELELLRRMVDELIKNGDIDADSYAEAAERLGEIFGGKAVGNMRSEEEASDGTETHDARKIGDHGRNGDSVTEDGLYTGTVEDGNTVDDIPSEDDAYDEDINTDKYGEDHDELPMETLDSMGADGTDTDSTEGDTDAEDAEGGKKADISEMLANICSSLLEIINSEKARRGTEDGIRSARRELCSTGFSKGSAADVHSGADGLTPMQRELAKRAGLSYREYAQLLSEIPKNARKRKQQVQTK